MQVSQGQDSNWRSKAACKGVDPRIFFPEGYTDGAKQEVAYSYCRACSVTRECFTSALEEESLRRGVAGMGSSVQGIRGGRPANTRWLVHQKKLTINQALNSPIPVYNVSSRRRRPGSPSNVV